MSPRTVISPGTWRPSPFTVTCIARGASPRAGLLSSGARLLGRAADVGAPRPIGPRRVLVQHEPALVAEAVVVERGRRLGHADAAAGRRIGSAERGRLAD